MATYISLLNLTEQGVRNIKQSPERAEAFKAAAAKLGVTVKSLYYTVGNYDLVTVTEGPDDAMLTLLAQVGSMGNVRTQTLRAYSIDEMKTALSKM